MSFSLKRTLAGLLSAGAFAACGAEFTAKSDTDGGTGASSGSGNTQGTGSGGTSGGMGGTSGGRGGSGAATGGTSAGRGGALGSSGAGLGGSDGASGRGGSGGTAGNSGRGGSGGGGGSAGSSGRGGSGGTAGGSGGASGTSAGTSGGPGDASPDALVCTNPDAKCSDNSCSRLLWTFDSGALDGIASASGQSLAVRTFNGSAALAVDVVQLNQAEITFTLPICLSGTLNVSAKTLSFRVYFAGGPASTGEFYVGASLPDVGTGYISDVYTGTATWVTYSDALSKSSRSSTAKTITIRAGSTGAPFSGTVWFDDFRIQ